MPDLVDFGPHTAFRPVATEDELLSFCNAIREAGGANILDELLPSEPNNSSACLIANALNFGCSVAPGQGYFTDDEGETIGLRWEMRVSVKTTVDQRSAIAKAISDAGGEDVKFYPRYDYTYVWSEEDGKHVPPKNPPVRDYAVHLPVHIGNAADAFDSRLAFTKFVAEGF